MPNTNRPLPIQCPKCQHIGCTLVVKSLSVIMVNCVSCGHTWAAALEWLPEETQEKARIAAADT